MEISSTKAKAGTRGKRVAVILAVSTGLAAILLWALALEGPGSDSTPGAGMVPGSDIDAEAAVPPSPTSAAQDKDWVE